jgi:hypothetical protein
MDKFRTATQLENMRAEQKASWSLFSVGSSSLKNLPGDVILFFLSFDLK